MSASVIDSVGLIYTFMGICIFAIGCFLGMSIIRR